MAPSGPKKPLIPRWFKVLLVVAFPFGVTYQLAGLAWALGVSATVAVVFLILVRVHGVTRERL